MADLLFTDFDLAALDQALAKAGLALEAPFGDWDGSPLSGTARATG